MSQIGIQTTRIFGNAGVLADGSAVNQLVPETVPVGVTGRKFPGPMIGGSWSCQVTTTAAGGATSALTFGYSNLPNPDPAVDSHWEDSGITAVALDALATKIIRPAALTLVAWVRVKAVVAASAAGLVVYAKSEGVS